MEAAGTAAEDIKDVMHGIGQTVVTAAVPRAPVLSGALAGSIRAGRGRTNAVVRAGGAAVPYAGVIHYGWPKRNITPQPFLTDALDATRQEVLHQLDEGINALLKKQHLT